MKTEDLYPRKCDATNKGMKEGWCWGDGVHYTSTLEETLKECRVDEEHILAEFIGADYQTYNEPNGQNGDGVKEIDLYNSILIKVKAKEPLTDLELLNVGYWMDYVYYTEWEKIEDEEQDFAYDENGVEYNLVNNKWIKAN